MAFAILTLGVCSIIWQFVMLRELAITFSGNELSMGVVLFCWLAGLSAGAALGRFFKKTRSDKIILARLFLFNAVWFFIGLFLCHWLKIFFAIPAWEIVPPLQMIIISAVALVPQTISLGLCFVLVSDIINNPARAYYLEAAGAFLSGLASLVIIKHLNPSQIVWVLSTLSLFAGLSIKPKNIFGRAALISGIILNILLAVSGMVSAFENYTNGLRFRPQQLVAACDSIYANITVTKTGPPRGAGNVYNLYENGALSFSTEDTESLEEAANLSLLSSHSVKNILLVGPAVSGIIRELLKHPVERIDYIEPDRKLIDTVLKYIPQAKDYGLESAKLKIYNLDTKAFIKSTRNKYDAVMLNLGGPQSLQSNRFYTAEFFQGVKNILKDNGKFSLAISSKEDILAGNMLVYDSCIYKTLASVFTNVEIIPGERLILIASNKPGIIISPEKMVERFLQRNIKTDYLTKETIKAKFIRRDYILGKIKECAKGVFLNQDYLPYGFLYYLTVMGKQSGIGFAAIWSVTNKINIFYIIAIAFIVCLLWRKNPAKISVLTTGFAGIGLEIIISMIFQINFGFLYYSLGVIIASFMLGAALGAAASIVVKKSVLKTLFYSEILIAIMSILTCVALKNYEFVYFLFVIIIGFLVGWEFGLFNRLYKVSAVYSLDAAGACIASILVSLVLIPALGIYQACIAIASFKLILAGFLRRQLR